VDLEVLQRAGAEDVPGFGLAGHLVRGLLDDRLCGLAGVAVERLVRPGRVVVRVEAGVRVEVALVRHDGEDVGLVVRLLFAGQAVEGHGEVLLAEADGAAEPTAR